MSFVALGLGFFNVTLERPDLVRHLTTVHEPRKAPVVLSQEEVARLLEAAPGLKYKAALSVAYGAGPRVSEVANLKGEHEAATAEHYWRKAGAQAKLVGRQSRPATPAADPSSGRTSMTQSSARRATQGVNQRHLLADEAVAVLDCAMR